MERPLWRHPFTLTTTVNNALRAQRSSRSRRTTHEKDSPDVPPLSAHPWGAAAGAALGGVTGALIGLGIPEYKAKRYEGKIKAGNILISVHAYDSTARARAKTIFERAGAEDISYTEEAGVEKEARGKHAHLSVRG